MKEKEWMKGKYKHLIEANGAEGALHNVCNGHAGSYYRDHIELQRITRNTVLGSDIFALYSFTI